MKRIYLDANATTSLRPEVRTVMMDIYDHVWANASSVHEDGQRARAAVEIARAQIAAGLGTRPEELLFTSGATEANNTAIASAVETGLQAGKNHVVVSRVEHPSAIGPIEKMVDAGTIECTWIEPDGYGTIESSAILDAVTDETSLVVMMAANNEIGNIYPIKEISTSLRDQEIHLHCDCVQQVGKVPLNLNELGVSSASISGHKVHGPKGVGALYLRSGLRLNPFIVGGHQERERRAGTEAVALIGGFGAAVEWATGPGLSSQIRIEELRNMLWDGIEQRIAGVHRNGTDGSQPSLPNTLNVSFDDTEGETLLISLDLAGVSVSSGSACTAGSLEPSHVLLAMALAPERARAAVRFSLSYDTKRADIETVLSVLPDIVQTVRMADPSLPSHTNDHALEEGQHG